MLDNEKIRLMTQIAMYEKGKGKEDIKSAQYFEKDFVSFRNFKMQLSVTFALLIVLGIEFANLLLDNMAVITANQLIWLGIKFIIIWTFFMVAYTWITTYLNKKSYIKSKERLEAYEKLLSDLEAIQ